MDDCLAVRCPVVSEHFTSTKISIVTVYLQLFESRRYIIFAANHTGISFHSPTICELVYSPDIAISLFNVYTIHVCQFSRALLTKTHRASYAIGCPSKRRINTVAA